MNSLAHQVSLYNSSEGKSAYEVKLIQRLRNTIHKRCGVDNLLDQIFMHAVDVVATSPFPLIGIGALKCLRDFDDGSTKNFLDILISAQDKNNPDDAIMAMAETCMRVFHIGRREALERLVSIATECGILSEFVGHYAQALLNQQITTY